MTMNNHVWPGHGKVVRYQINTLLPRVPAANQVKAWPRALEDFLVRTAQVPNLVTKCDESTDGYILLEKAHFSAQYVLKSSALIGSICLHQFTSLPAPRALASWYCAKKPGYGTLTNMQKPPNLWPLSILMLTFCIQLPAKVPQRRSKSSEAFLAITKRLTCHLCVSLSLYTELVVPSSC